MNTEEIRSYAILMKDLGLTGMEVKNEDFSIRLEMNRGESLSSDKLIVPDSYIQTGITPAAVEPKEDVHSVMAKFVGVFYSSPAENEEAYVKVGDKVSKGQTVCIIEAMKLINEIPMEEDGVITEVCARHGQLVEYGTELFKYRV